MTQHGRVWLIACLVVVAASAAFAPTSIAASRLRAPALQSPARNASVQSLPTFEWASVSKAASYQFELAADQNFGAIVSNGSFATPNTAATLGQAVSDGVYYWRVRAISAKDSAGSWSARRKLVKAWTTSPRLLAPSGTSVNWPAQPLVFSWSQVPHAVKYLLTVATDHGLANQVIGSTSSPLATQATVYTPSASLTQGTYFWAVTPLDAEGHKGQRSTIASFTYAWPTTTTTAASDLNPDLRVFDPQFSWAPIAGAARYQVEVNSSSDFPSGSDWCCSNTTIGTSMAPPRVLANNGYYWRVRAIDARGNTGVWNTGPNFTKAFDNITPSIPNLRLVDASNNAVSGSGSSPASTDTPIVTWDPVPGASRYQVQLTPFQGLGCDWSLVNTSSAYHSDTSTTAWTPLGNYGGHHVGPTAWPNPQNVGSPLLTGKAYCLRVLARSDDDAQGGQVVSDWTQINGLNQPAFFFADPPPVGSPAPNLPMPAGNYRLPSTGTTTPRTPFFSWQRVSGAQGYFVVIARDAGFTQVVDIGYTNVPAYAPELANGAPLSDETTAYYWAALPTTGLTGSGEFSDWSQDSPQTFNKASLPPTLLIPASGSNVSIQPTFEWTAAENARNYTLQVSGDPSFGNPIDNVITDATAYTSNSTYPADRQLYWRVRANDWTGQGLNWSATQTFVRSLPVPVPSQHNATRGEPIPVLNWAPVQGATGYEVHVDWVNGTTSNLSLTAPAFTPVAWYGVGVWRWQVRADFPTTTGASATSGYSPSQVFVRTLNPPTGAHGVKSAHRLVISWNPDPAAKQYEVDVSSTDGFANMVDSRRTDNTSWASSLDLTKPTTRGRLYWRVAAIDGAGNVGTFVSGAFGKKIRPHRKRK
jgi:hypothetical protein